MHSYLTIARLSITDYFLLVLLFLILISELVGIESHADCLQNVIMMSGIYFLARFLDQLFPKKFEQLCLFSVLLLTVFQISLGLYQILSTPNHNVVKALHGSFANSGPYAGFISMCSCILLAFYFFADLRPRLRAVALYVALASCLLIPASLSRASLLSLATSLMIMVNKTKRGHLLLRKYWKLMIITGLVASVSLYMLKKPSADGRFLLDKICVRMIDKNGLLGSGLGSFQKQYGIEQANYFQETMISNGDDLDWNCVIERERMSADCVQFAFNDYLQLGVEAGLLAMIFFILSVVSSLYIAYSNNNYWFYGLIVFSLLACFSYPSHLMLFQVVVPIIVAMCNSSGYKGNNSSLIGLSIICTIVGLFFIMHITNTDHKNSMKEKWNTIRSLYEHEYYDIVVERCEGLYFTSDVDYHFLFAYGQSLNKIGQYEKSDSILIIGSKISCDPMFWNVMGNNSASLGKYREAEERYKHAFYMLPNRLYPLSLLAKLYYTEGDSGRFIKMYDKIETFVPKVENANTAKIRNEIRQLRDNKE